MNLALIYRYRTFCFDRNFQNTVMLVSNVSNVGDCCDADFICWFQQRWWLHNHFHDFFCVTHIWNRSSISQTCHQVGKIDATNFELELKLHWVMNYLWNTKVKINITLCWYHNNKFHSVFLYNKALFYLMNRSWTKPLYEWTIIYF